MSETILTLDIGNTASKLTLFDGNQIRETKRVASLIEVYEECSRRQCNAVVYSSTRDFSDEEKALLNSCGWWKFNSERNLPLKIEYNTPFTLGPDRLAAAIGAVSMFDDEDLMVVDAGTALTIDLVTADGSYKGGNISPGISLRFRSLHEFTSRLPLVATEDPHIFFGHDTESAIRCGVEWGIVNEILGAFRLANLNYSCNRMVLTGGDSENINKWLLRMEVLPFSLHLEPDLVAFGLKKAYEYNHE